MQIDLMRYTITDEIRKYLQKTKSLKKLKNKIFYYEATNFGEDSQNHKNKYWSGYH